MSYGKRYAHFHQMSSWLLKRIMRKSPSREMRMMAYGILTNRRAL